MPWSSILFSRNWTCPENCLWNEQRYETCMLCSCVRIFCWTKKTYIFVFLHIYLAAHTHMHILIRKLFAYKIFILLFTQVHDACVQEACIQAAHASSAASWNAQWMPKKTKQARLQPAETHSCDMTMQPFGSPFWHPLLRNFAIRFSFAFNPMRCTPKRVHICPSPRSHCRRTIPASASGSGKEIWMALSEPSWPSPAGITDTLQHYFFTTESSSRNFWWL